MKTALDVMWGINGIENCKVLSVISDLGMSVFGMKLFKFQILYENDTLRCRIFRDS